MLIGWSDDEGTTTARQTSRPAPIPGNGRQSRDTAAAKRVIDNGARMTMRFRVLTGPEKLYGASDGRQSRPAGQCIAIFEQIAVEGISFRGILC